MFNVICHIIKELPNHVCDQIEVIVMTDKAHAFIVWKKLEDIVKELSNMFRNGVLERWPHTEFTGAALADEVSEFHKLIGKLGKLGVKLDPTTVLHKFEMPIVPIMLNFAFLALSY